MLGTSSLVPAKSEAAVKDSAGWLEVGKKNKAIVIRTVRNIHIVLQA